MEKTVGIIISIGIVVLLGVILVGIVSDQAVLVTQLKVAPAESQNLFSNGCWHESSGVQQVNGTTDINCNSTLAYAPTDWRAEDCQISSVVVLNNTKALTAGVDYNFFPKTGTLQMLNTTRTSSGAAGLGADNATLTSYNYCGSDYINQSWARTVLDLVPGFFVLALLVAAAFVLFWILKQEGVDTSF